MGELSRNLNTALDAAANLMINLDREVPAIAAGARGTTEEAQEMLQLASKTLKNLEAMASREGEIGRTLEELRAAARSIRVMAEYLERHPEALIQGKGATQ